jgi:hypothetical protein
LGLRGLFILAADSATKSEAVRQDAHGGQERYGGVQVSLTILPDQVLLDGHALLKLRESERFLACFGNPSRRREIPMHPSGTRVAMVWDDLGLVAYEDRPELTMSHLYLAFDPNQTPERPRQSYKSHVEINSGTVTNKTLERTLPRNGPTQILADFGKHFFYEAEAYTVHFDFERRPNPSGRYPITGHLIDVSFQWRQ